MLEKALDQVLRVPRRMAATTHKSVERRPITLAKIGERFSCLTIRLRLARLQHDRPMRRLERRTTLLQRARNRFRKSVQYQRRESASATKSADPKAFAKSAQNQSTLRLLHLCCFYDANKRPARVASRDKIRPAATSQYQPNEVGSNIPHGRLENPAHARWRRAGTRS